MGTGLMNDILFGELDVRTATIAVAVAEGPRGGSPRTRRKLVERLLPTSSSAKRRWLAGLAGYWNVPIRMSLSWRWPISWRGFCAVSASQCP
jgi:hypothetical protein